MYHILSSFRCIFEVATKDSSLSIYVALGNQLTARVSFTMLSVFNILRYPFFMLPMAVKSTVGALVAMLVWKEYGVC